MPLELVKPGEKPIKSVCAKLKSIHPHWLLLDEDYLRNLLREEELPEQTHFIVPGSFIHKRRHAYKTSTLASYLMVSNRMRDNTFHIVANSWDEVDYRIRRLVEPES